MSRKLTKTILAGAAVLLVTGIASAQQFVPLSEEWADEVAAPVAAYGAPELAVGLGSAFPASADEGTVLESTAGVGASAGVAGGEVAGSGDD